MYASVCATRYLLLLSIFLFIFLSHYHSTSPPPPPSLSYPLPALSLFSLPFLHLRFTLILSLPPSSPSYTNSPYLYFTLSLHPFFLLLPRPFSSLLSSSCHVFIFLSLLHLPFTLVFCLPSTLALLHLSLSLSLCSYSPPPCECWKCCFEGVCRRSTKAIKLTAWRGGGRDQLSVFTSAGDVT